MSVTMIVTDHKWRELRAIADIPLKNRSSFEYIRDDDSFSTRLVHYKRQWHDVLDMMPAWDSLRLLGWDVFHAWSFSSGIAIAFHEDGERVKVAYVYQVSRRYDV